ncbi:MAG: aminotransferase class IV [Planctomycetota bacterium]
MPELAYVNGVFSSIADAKVSIEDRGFQFGDGVYEVIVAYGGKLFLLDDHIRRFRTSAEAIHLEYDFEGQPLEPILREGLRRSGLADVMIYVQITRGVAPRSHVIPPGMSPTVVMTFKPIPTVAEELRRRGGKVVTVRDNRWANCYVKAITLLPNVLAKNDAIRRGCNDAVFVSPGGEVRECTSANIYMICGGALTFPPRTESVLHGITQQFVMGCAAGIGMSVCEESFTVDRLRSADEVFMSSTTVEVLGITSIDGRIVGDGKVGPYTLRLHDEFRRRSRGRSLQRGSA